MPRWFLISLECHFCYVLKLGSNCACDNKFCVTCNQSNILAFKRSFGGGGGGMLQLLKIAVKAQDRIC